MLKIKVCVGSSCYLKGAQNIIDFLQKTINERGIKGNVEIAGAFCLGNCGDGIAISINDEIKHISTAEEACSLLEFYINEEK